MDISPDDSSTPVVETPDESTSTPTEASPVETPTPTDASPVETPTPTDASPVETPTPADVTPKEESPTPDESSPVEETASPVESTATPIEPSATPVEPSLAEESPTPVEPSPTVVPLEDVDQDGFTEGEGDCDDSRADVHPGAQELCDEVDNNCDGAIDEGVQTTYYGDSDGDGFGTDSATLEACSTPDGYSSISGDCDDARTDVYPGAEELCDGADNDCDAEVDEGVLTTFYSDGDGDDYGKDDQTTESCELPEGFARVGGDCDDTREDIHPNAAEACDGVDNDCDSSVDEGVLATYYVDGDEDGFGDDANSIESCSQPDGYVDAGGDCDDSLSSTNPGAPEFCDGVDNDCDGLTDNNPTNPSTFYLDFDVDSYGDPDASTTACSLPSGYVENDEDCDDLDPSINPDAEEIPANGVDENCDGVDNGWQDLNQDGYPDMIVSNAYDGSSY